MRMPCIYLLVSLQTGPEDTEERGDHSRLVAGSFNKQGTHEAYREPPQDMSTPTDRTLGLQGGLGRAHSCLRSRRSRLRPWNWFQLRDQQAHPKGREGWGASDCPGVACRSRAAMSSRWPPPICSKGIVLQMWQQRSSGAQSTESHRVFVKSNPRATEWLRTC